MKTSRYSVIDREIDYIETTTITGNENVDTFQFEFDSEWDSFGHKFFLLNVDGTCYIDELNENNEVVLRSIAYDNDNVTFGVYGINGSSKLSSNIVWLETTPSAFGQIKDVDNIPDKDVWVEYTQEMLGLLAQGQITLEDCQSILTQIQEIQRDVTSKGEAFDSNYTQKLKAFNDNFTEKLAAFNTNATNKTEDFDSNATSKTTTFNDNATSKTTTFNNNATNKTTAFNNNYTEKVGEVNQIIADFKAYVATVDYNYNNLQNKPQTWAALIGGE